MASLDLSTPQNCSLGQSLESWQSAVLSASQVRQNESPHVCFIWSVFLIHRTPWGGSFVNRILQQTQRWVGDIMIIDNYDIVDNRVFFAGNLKSGSSKITTPLTHSRASIAYENHAERYRKSSAPQSASESTSSSCRSSAHSGQLPPVHGSTVRARIFLSSQNFNKMYSVYKEVRVLHTV